MNYDVFISYSSSVDSQLAKSLQRGLEKLGKPIFKPKMMSVFLDDNDLSASPNLWSSIQEALQNSRYIIILASLESAKSRWVEKEIKFWKEQHGVEKILIGLTDGNIIWNYDSKKIQSASLNNYTKNIFNNEPLWVDLRKFNKDSFYKLDDIEFKKAVSEFSSAILGVRKESLIREDLKKSKRLVRLRNWTIFLLTTLLILSTTLFLRSLNFSEQLQAETVGRLDKALEANRNNIISFIMLSLDENPGESLKLVEMNYELHKKDWRSTNLLFKAFYNEAPLYRSVTDKFSSINSVSMKNDSTWLVTTADQNLYYYNEKQGRTLICNQDQIFNIKLQDRILGYNDEKPISDSAVNIESENARVFTFPHSLDIIIHDGDRLKMIDSIGDSKAKFSLDLLREEGGQWSVDLSKDGRYLLATSNQYGLVIFDISKRKKVGPFWNKFHGAKFSSNGKYLLVPYYNYMEGVSPRLLKIKLKEYIKLKSIELMSSSPYQNLKTILEVKVYKGIKSAITCIKESDDGSLMFAGTELGELIVWNASGKIISYSKPHRARVDFLEIHKDTEEIVSASRDLSILVSDFKGKVLQTLRGHKYEINGLFVNSKGTIYSSDKSGAFYQWLRSMPTKIKEYKISTEEFDFDVAEDNTIFAINNKGNISRISSKSGLISKFGYQKDANKIDVDNDNKRFLAYKLKSYWTSEGSEYNRHNEIQNVKIWNTSAATSANLKLNCLLSDYIFLQDSSLVVEVYSDRIELNDQNHSMRTVTYPNSIKNLRFHACSNVYTGQGSNGKLVTLEKGTNKDTLIPLRNLKFTKDIFGNFTTTCSQNSVFMFTNENPTQGMLSSIETNDANSWNGDIIGHYANITCAVFSKSEAYLLTGSDDGTVRVWNKNNEEIYQYPINAPIRKIMLSKDDKYLYVGSEDGKLRVYLFDPAELLKIIKTYTRDGYLQNLDADAKSKFGFD